MTLSDYAAGAQHGQEDRRKGLALDDAEHLAQWATASDEWRRGWGDGYEQG